MMSAFRISILLTAVATTAVFSCTVTNAKKDSNPPGTGSGKKISEADFGPGDSVSAYADFCKHELGLPPEVLDGWRCLDGVEIPVKIDDKQPDATSYALMKKNNGGCDIASWLGDAPCANYAFVQERELSKDVNAIFLCRMRTYGSHLTASERKETFSASGSDEDFHTLYQFDSIGLFWTHKQTGKTCYFDYVGQSYGGYVPSPDQWKGTEWDQLPEPKPPAGYKTNKELMNYWSRSGTDTWKKPSEVSTEDNCVRCHDSGPYKSSPWISQVFNVPANNPGIPQIVVGEAFADWKTRFPMVAISTQPIKSTDGRNEDQVCTQCHRIGSQATCENFLSYSTGKSSPAELSDRGKSFFYRTWMPPPPDEWHGKLEAELTGMWQEKYERHVARLQCCCDNPTAKGCTTQPFDVYPIPKATAGKGPGICP